MPAKKQPLFIIYAGVIAAMIFWSVTFVWVKQLLQLGLSPTSIIFLRLLVTSACLLPFIIFGKLFSTIQRKDILSIMMLAFFEPFLYYIGEVNGIHLVSANIASVIIATIPVFLPFAARFFINEKLLFRNYAGILLSFAGVIVIVFNKDGSLFASVKGLLFLFMAVFSAVGYTIIAKRLLQVYSPLQIVSVKILLGCLYFLPVFLFNDYSSFRQVTLGWKPFLMIVALGLFGNFVAYFLYNRAIQKIGASKSAIFANLIPVFTVIFSYFILDEYLDERKYLGIALTLAGIYISQTLFISRKYKKERKDISLK